MILQNVKLSAIMTIMKSAWSNGLRISPVAAYVGDQLFHTIARVKATFYYNLQTKIQILPVKSSAILVSQNSHISLIFLEGPEILFGWQLLLIEFKGGKEWKQIELPQEEGDINLPWLKQILTMVKIHLNDTLLFLKWVY